MKRQVINWCTPLTGENDFPNTPLPMNKKHAGWAQGPAAQGVGAVVALVGIVTDCERGRRKEGRQAKAGESAGRRTNGPKKGRAPIGKERTKAEDDDGGDEGKS